MNAYDFDKTIYDGDSTADFIIFCMKKRPYIIPKLALNSLGYIGYKASFCSKTDFKENLYSFLRYFNDTESLIEKFWDEHIKKIKKWYLAQKKDDDAIISASPFFLLKPVCDRLGIKNLLASNVDITTGCYLGNNCYGAVKVKRFTENFTDKIDKFYSDSKSDEPLAKLAKSAYLVDGDLIRSWDFQ